MHYPKVMTEIDRLISNATDARNDGFTQFYNKKILYQIKWRIDEYFENSHEFTGEEEWLKEKEKERMWSKLKK